MERILVLPPQVKALAKLLLVGVEASIEQSEAEAQVCSAQIAPSPASALI